MGKIGLGRVILTDLQLLDTGVFDLSVAIAEKWHFFTGSLFDTCYLECHFNYHHSLIQCKIHSALCCV